MLQLKPHRCSHVEPTYTDLDVQIQFQHQDFPQYFWFIKLLLLFGVCLGGTFIFFSLFVLAGFDFKAKLSLKYKI